MADPPPKKISLNFGAKKVAPPKPVIGKRPRSALQDNDHDFDEAPVQEEVSHFDQSVGGAIQASKKVVDKGPLVIPVGPNRYKQHGQPPSKEPKEDGETTSKTEKDKGPEMIYGLNVRIREASPDGAKNGEPSSKDAEEVVVKERTEDEAALDALLGNKQTSQNAIIPVVNEEEAFHKDYDEAPDVPSLNDYAAIPVEQFGAALLRGMGWKDGEAIGRNKGQDASKVKKIERRPALLGVGAKAAASIGIEIGAWGKQDRGKQDYTPVVLKNKVTGEVITETELKEKLAEQKNAELEVERGNGDSSHKTSRHRDDRDGRDRRRDRDGVRDDKDRRHERDRYRDSERHRSKRERSASRERRRKYADSDSESDSRSRRKDDKYRHRDRSRDRDRGSRDYRDSRSDRKDRDREYKDRGSASDSKHRSRRYNDDRYDSNRKHRDERDDYYERGSSRKERR